MRRSDPPIRFDGVLHWYVYWFDPTDDRCSLCGELIPEDDVPLILFYGHGDATEQARIHWSPCAESLFARGYLKENV